MEPPLATRNPQSGDVTDPLDDPSCTLMIMERGRSLDERMLSAVEPRRRRALAAKGVLRAKNKQASMSNLEVGRSVPSRKKSKGREEMRGGAARGINHLLQNANISLAHITEIYLSTAAATGNVRELKRLGKLPGASINGCDERGRTAAHIAVEEGQLEALKVLVEDLDADVNAREEHGASLFYVAASRNFVDALYLLDELEGDVDLPTFDGATPAYIASFYGFVDVLRALDDLKADFNKPMNDGATPAFIAAASGQVAALRMLKQLGADLDKPTKDGATPAFIAAQEGQVESLRMLGELGADLDAADDDGATPACIAAQEGQTAALMALGALGADLNAATVDGATPACIAAKVGRVGVVRTLGALGADLDKPNRKGVGPIHIAAFCGNVSALRALNDLKARLDAREEHGATPMFIAAANNQVASINTLFALGANFETPTFDGIAPSHIAAANGQTEALRAMLALGCPIDTKTRDGATPALLAAKNGNVETLELLLAHGASLPEDVSVFVERFSFSGTVCALLTEAKKQQLRNKYLRATPLPMWTAVDLRDHLLGEFGGNSNTGSAVGLGLKRPEAAIGASLTFEAAAPAETSTLPDADSLLRDLLGGGSRESVAQGSVARNELAKVPDGRAVALALLKCPGAGEEGAWEPLDRLLRPVLGQSLTGDEQRAARAARRAAVRANARAERRAVRGLSDDEDEEDDRFEGDAAGSDDDDDDGDAEEEDEEDDADMAEREAYEQPWLNFHAVPSDVLRRAADSLASLARAAPLPLRSALRFGAALRDGATLRRPQAPPAMSAAKPQVEFATFRAESYAYSDRHVVLVLAAPPVAAAAAAAASDSTHGLARAASGRSPSFRSASFRSASFRSSSGSSRGVPSSRDNRLLGDDHVLVCCVDIQTVFAPGGFCASPVRAPAGNPSFSTAPVPAPAALMPGAAAVGALANDVFWVSPEDLSFPPRVPDGASAGEDEKATEDAALVELAAAAEAAIGATDWATAELLLAFAATLMVRPWWREWARQHLEGGGQSDEGDESCGEGSADGTRFAAGADVARGGQRSGGRRSGSRQRSGGGLGALARCLPLALAASDCSPLQWAALRLTATLLRFADEPPTTSAAAAHAVATATAAVGVLELGLSKLRPGVPTAPGASGGGGSGGAWQGDGAAEASPLVTWAAALVRSPTAGRLELAAALAPLEPCGQVCADGPCDALTPALVAAIRAALRAADGHPGRRDPAQDVRALIFSSPGARASRSSTAASRGALPFGTCRLATVLAAWLGEAPAGPSGAATSPAAVYALYTSSGGLAAGASAGAAARGLGGAGSAAANESARAAAGAVLMSVWEQALANRPDLPVAHLFLLLPPPPPALDVSGSSSSSSGNSGNGSGDGRGEPVRSGGLLPLLEGVCARVLADPWWRGSSSENLRFHAAAWRALREATNTRDDEPSALRALCAGDAALRDDLQRDGVFGPPPAASGAAALSIAAVGAAVEGQSSSSSSSSAAAMPLPPAPRPPAALSLEDERDDEEARWMAGERLDPNQETAATAACRRAVGRSLVHAADALQLRACLLPSRHTPGLWAGLDSYGVAAADAQLQQLKRDARSLAATVEPLLTHACAQHLAHVLAPMRLPPPAAAASGGRSTRGLALLDAATCRLDFEASLDAWLRGGVRHTLAAVLVAHAAAAAEGASAAAAQLEAAMAKLWTVAASAAKFLAKLPGQADPAGSSSDCEDGAAALVLRRTSLDALALDVTSPHLFDPDSSRSHAAAPPSVAARLLADALARLPAGLDDQDDGDGGDGGGGRVAFGAAPAAAAASAGSRRGGGAFGGHGDAVGAYYESLEAEKRAALKQLSAAVGLVATDAASGATCQLASRLRQAGHDLTLAVAAARAVLDAIRKLDPRALPAALRATQALRRRALALLARWAHGPAARKLLPPPGSAASAAAAAGPGQAASRAAAASDDPAAVAALVALAPRFSFEAFAAQLFPALALLAAASSPADDALFRDGGRGLAAAVAASLLPRGSSSGAAHSAAAAAAAREASGDGGAGGSGGGGLGRFKAAGRSLATARGTAAAFAAAGVDGKSRTLGSLEAVGAAIADLARLPSPGSEEVAVGPGAAAEADAWAAALAWLCASVADALPEPARPPPPNAPPLPLLLLPPQLLPGAFHATCLALSGGGGSSNFAAGSPPVPWHALPPGWALFRVRRPLQLQDLRSDDHHRPDGGGNGNGNGNGHSFLVVCFRGSDCGAAAGNPDWLNDLFDAKDEPATLAGLGDAWAATGDADDGGGGGSGGGGDGGGGDLGERGDVAAARAVVARAAAQLLDVSLHGPWLARLAAVLPRLLAALRDARRRHAGELGGELGGGEAVWCTGHGLGGAYAQLLQLLLRAGAAPSGDALPSQRGSGRGGGGSGGVDQRDGDAGWASACAGCQCAVFGAPQVVCSDPLGCVAPLFRAPSDDAAAAGGAFSAGGAGPPLQCFVFGHDVVPRVLASPPKPLASLTAAEALQRRRIGQYSPRFQELAQPGGVAYLPLGAYVFLQPAAGSGDGGAASEAGAAGEPGAAAAVAAEVLVSRPLEQWSVEPQQSAAGARLLRRLAVEWSVLPLAPRLHDGRASYAHALRVACGLDAPPRHLPATHLPPPDLWATRRPPRQEPPPQQQQQQQQQRRSAPAAVSPTSGSSTSSRGSTSSSGGGSHKGTPPAASFPTPSSAGQLYRTTVGSGGSFSEREQRQAHDRAADDDDAETEASANNLAVFLALAKLSQHEATLRLEGYEEVDDLADADDEDLLRAGLKKPEIRRLRRYLSEHE